uniref:Uncharacterized protein n=1 Tax=Ciona savignyi TaxID=51511 RepID=H2ZFG2_CIOSA
SSTKLVLVQHLNNESERKGLWEDFFGANGIVVLAVFVCVLATSLVWLIVLCYTRSKHDGALSTNTESTEFQPVDSSSHGSLEKPTLHRHLHSRSDLMSTPIRHNCQSFPRNYVEQTMGNPLNPASPSDRHFCDRIHQNRTLQQHPVRALSTSHMHNTRIESAHVHRSTQCLSSPAGPRCASNPHKRP